MSSPVKNRAVVSPLIIVGALFFIFGFVTWLSSVLIPYLQIACELNNFQSYLVAFAFYISYFIAGIPFRLVIEENRIQERIILRVYCSLLWALYYLFLQQCIDCIRFSYWGYSSRAQD